MDRARQSFNSGLLSGFVYVLISGSLLIFAFLNNLYSFIGYLTICSFTYLAIRSWVIRAKDVSILVSDDLDSANATGMYVGAVVCGLLVLIYLLVSLKLTVLIET